MTGRQAIGILGDAHWALGLGQLAAGSGRQVLIHTTHPSTSTSDRPSHLQQVNSLAALTEDAHLILLALPPSQSRTWIRQLSAHLDGSHLLVHAVRGFEPGRATTISQVIRAESCVRKVGALAGPAFVDDLHVEQPNAAVIASAFPEVIDVAKAVFTNPTFRVYHNNDVRGVEIASAAARVMAVALGLCLELELGDATLALLTTRCVAEIARLCKACGGKHDTAFGLAGLGDLLMQRESNSREVQIGRLLARGTAAHQAFQQLEGEEIAQACDVFAAIIEQTNTQAFIIDEMHKVFHDQRKALHATQHLMQVSQLAE